MNSRIGPNFITWPSYFIAIQKKKKTEKIRIALFGCTFFQRHASSRSFMKHRRALCILYTIYNIYILNFPILSETQIRYLSTSQKNFKSEIDGKPRLRITLSLSRSFITMLLEKKEPIPSVFPENVLMYGNGNPKPDDLLLESLSWLLACM